MKKTLTIIVFTAIISISYGKEANIYDETIEKISNAIRAGDSHALAAFFGNTIDLTIPGSEGNYSKNQAEIILKNFFDTNTPKSFTLNHQGSSKDGSLYSIGTLTTNNGVLRVYFLIKKTNDNFLIQQLQIEAQ